MMGCGIAHGREKDTVTTSHRCSRPTLSTSLTRSPSPPFIPFHPSGHRTDTPSASSSRCTSAPCNAKWKGAPSRGPLSPRARFSIFTNRMTTACTRAVASCCAPAQAADEVGQAMGSPTSGFGGSISRASMVCRRHLKMTRIEPAPAYRIPACAGDFGRKEVGCSLSFDFAHTFVDASRRDVLMDVCGLASIAVEAEHVPLCCTTGSWWPFSSHRLVSSIALRLDRVPIEPFRHLQRVA
jgi:hypothetical protein